jgi:rRNA maturation protein Nop10
MTKYTDKCPECGSAMWVSYCHAQYTGLALTGRNISPSGDFIPDDPLMTYRAGELESFRSDSEPCFFDICQCCGLTVS